MNEAWMARLPEDEAASAAEGRLQLSGLLVSAPPGRVLLFVGSIYLEFHTEDVIAIEEICVSGDAKFQCAVRVELTLRAGAVLAGIYDTAALPVSLIGGPRSFALSTRTGGVRLPEAPAFRQAEREYFQRYGIAREP